MKFRIYQINMARDKNGVKFMGRDRLQKLQGTQEIDASLYDEVFFGEVDCENLEEVFLQFNTQGHPLMRGHSLSVSDVVKTEDCAYFCDRVGFEKVDFDKSKTQKPENLLTVVFIEPGKAPVIGEVQDTLENLQRAVGGNIECVYNEDKTAIICNEEGKLMGLKGNRRIEGDVLAGNIFIVGLSEENFRSLTEEEQQKYMERFAEVEDISKEEVERNIFAKVITFH